MVSPLAALRAALPAANVSFNPATSYAYSEANARADAQACEVSTRSRVYVGLGISASQEQQASDPGAYSFGTTGPQYSGSAASLQVRDVLSTPLTPPPSTLHCFAASTCRLPTRVCSSWAAGSHGRGQKAWKGMTRWAVLAFL